MSVLGSSATKREARSYLQRFTPSKDASASTKPRPPETAQISCGNGVNLGGFYGARAVAESPKFVQQPMQDKFTLNPQLHVALVKIRAPQLLNDDTLIGIDRNRTLTDIGVPNGWYYWNNSSSQRSHQ